MEETEVPGDNHRPAESSNNLKSWWANCLNRSAITELERSKNNNYIV